MPLKKLCSKSDCNVMVDIGTKYCDRHQEQQTDRHRQYDTNMRDDKSTAFYHSRQWKVVRELAYNRDKGLCLDCFDNKRLVKGDVCDHTIPIKVDWSLRFELSNLRTLCHAHHNAKTAEDKKMYQQNK